ncbi:ecotin family protein [Microbulbifer taiwanensis]|uniref:Ecotin family protein n=1 Tax=Microbulbifer taiwanensis TaxID=986746 RepID=A0ABW1YQU8_9GAMM|nr:ecotin family protein [Microbulbifer taiwanensis]
MLLRCALSVALYSLVSPAPASELDAFPTTVDGKQRQVIRLPKAVDESRFMVELVPGKTELVDCNLRSYRAPIKRETLDGWGYPYFVLADPEPAATTLKACPSGSESRRFVRVRGEGLMLPYNSRLPLVVYLPADLQLKYRVWRADKTLSDARTE